MMRELERANLRRIYEDDDDDLVVQQNRNSPTANVMNSANSGNQANSTLKWEHLNKWSNSNETRAVNILPGRNFLVSKLYFRKIISFSSPEILNYC